MAGTGTTRAAVVEYTTYGSGEFFQMERGITPYMRTRTLLSARNALRS